MPKPPSQSEPYGRAEVVSDEAKAASQASGFATRTVITAAIVMIIALFLVVMIGLHIPAGG